MKSLAIPLLCLAGFAAQGQDHSAYAIKVEGDSLAVSTTESQVLILSRVRRNRSIILRPGRTVRIVALYKYGALVERRARITKIGDHVISFTPFDNRLAPITVADTSLTYMAFTTPWSVTRGIIVNGMLVSTIVIVAVVAVLDLFVSIFTGQQPIMSSWHGTGTGLADLPWDNFQRKIKVKNRKGVRKWNVLAVE